ncbi:MAG: hypothetical protein R6X31_01755 [Anaerolineae bacterium]
MNTSLTAMVETPVNRKVFATEEEGIHSLLREYIPQQVSQLQQELPTLESKHGVSFEQFAAYVHDRSVLLEGGDLSPEQRKVLGQATGQEEEDWLDSKVNREMPESWLRLLQEVSA